MRLADKVSIITGGGGGMGRVAARMFAEQGAKVVVAEYGEAAGRETVDQITAAGGQATFVQADVTRLGGITEFQVSSGRMMAEGEGRPYDAYGASPA